MDRLAPVLQLTAPRANRIELRSENAVRIRDGVISELAFTGVNTTLPERPIADESSGPQQAPFFAPW